jgi:hypothetical protein
VNGRAIALRAVTLGVAGLVLGAGPAAADAAEPGDYSSAVTSIEPDPGGFTIETAGGDAFLVLSVDEGTEVIVAGYEGEPYLRFSPDGTVEQNRRSPATYINADRFGTNDLAPDELQGEDPSTLEPEWEEVATGGTFAWHDHRTHYMGQDARVPRGETFAWDGPVPLLVNGEAVEVNGTITFHDVVSPLPWSLLAVLVAVLFGVFGGRLPERGPPGVVAIVALLATVVAAVGYTSQPAGTGASSVPAVVSGIAVVLALLAVVMTRLRAVLLLAAGVFLATWGVFRLAVLSNPVLPTDAPFALERLTTALALGIGVGAVVVAFRSGAFTTALLPSLDEE